MTVQPQAAAQVRPGTAVTVMERGESGSHTRGLRNNNKIPTQQPQQTHTNMYVPAPAQSPKPSGDVRIDGYTLWAFSDVFKGLVLDVRL